MGQIDCRDFERGRATEEVWNVNVFGVSQESAAEYDPLHHVKSNFNNSQQLLGGLKKCLALNIRSGGHPAAFSFFTVAILDYFWIPAGWDAQHWKSALF